MFSGFGDGSFRVQRLRVLDLGFSGLGFSGLSRARPRTRLTVRWGRVRERGF